MDTRYLLHTRRHARGAVKPVAIAIIAVVVMLAVGAWFLIIKPHQEMVLADAGGHPSSPVSVASRAAPPPPADVAAMDINQLLAEARKAMNEQRYLAPAGNNAFEFYLRALEKQPGNQVATDALRETFPFAATSAEQAINTRDFNEAQRQIDLLAKADPTNFTLTILRSKLDAQRKLLDKQQQQQTADQQKTELAAQKAVADKLAADKLAEQQKTLAEQQKQRPVAATPTPSQQTAAAAKPAATEAASAAGSGQNTEAVLVKSAAPNYPRPALQAQQTGWVVVAFTINTEGRPENVRVVDSQPRIVFGHAAVDAVNRYRFTPATKDGAAVASTRQQKIEFNL